MNSDLSQKQKKKILSEQNNEEKKTIHMKILKVSFIKLQ